MGADAPEGQLGHAGLHHHIVEADPAGAGCGEHLLLLGLITAEQVERQRFGPLADLLKGCGEVLEHQHRQERAEQLLSHQRILAVIHANHGGGDAPLFSADFASDQDATVRSGGLQQQL